MTEDDIRRAILSRVMGISSAIAIIQNVGDAVTIRCEHLDTNVSYQTLENRLAEIMNVLQPLRPFGIAFRIELMSLPGMVVVGEIGTGFPLIGSDRIKENTYEMMMMTQNPPPNLSTFELQQEQIRSRSRFSAVVEEMSDAVPAVSQPAPSARVERRTTPQLFEETIRVVDGVIDPCKKCGCSAYTLDFGQLESVKATCRGCPLPGPTYAVDARDAAVRWMPQNPYKCERCSTVTLVTMNLTDVNLHCPTCKQLTIYTTRGTEKAPTKVLTGSKATFTFNGKTVEGTVARSAFEFDLFSMPGFEPVGLPVKSGESWSIKKRRTGSVGFKELSTSYSPWWTDERWSDQAIHPQLVDSFRKILDLQPFGEYAYEQRTTNQKDGLKERDWNRRTGRTTRCLVDALATCVIEGYRMLIIRGRSNAIENDAVGMARPMIERIAGVLREADAKTVLPIPREQHRCNAKYPDWFPDWFTYVDHTVNDE